jgi:hypothetical protein
MLRIPEKLVFGSMPGGSGELFTWRTDKQEPLLQLAHKRLLPRRAWLLGDEETFRTLDVDRIEVQK